MPALPLQGTAFKKTQQATGDDRLIRVQPGEYFLAGYPVFVEGIFISFTGQAETYLLILENKPTGRHAAARQGKNIA